MNIYLSGPMAGLKDNNRPAFDAAATKLLAMGHKAYNPTANHLKLTYREHMEYDLAWICKRAQAIVMLPGWRSSPGAKVEHALAVALLIDIYLWPHDAGKLKR